MCLKKEFPPESACFIFERHALNTTESFLSLEVATYSPLLADFSFLSLFNAAYEY